MNTTRHNQREPTSEEKLDDLNRDLEAASLKTYMMYSATLSGYNETGSEVSSFTYEELQNGLPDEGNAVEGDVELFLEGGILEKEENYDTEKTFDRKVLAGIRSDSFHLTDYGQEVVEEFERQHTVEGLSEVLE